MKIVLTFLACNRALLSSLVIIGEVGEEFGVGHGVPVLIGEPGLPGLLGLSGEFVGLVVRGLDFNVIFIADAFLP